MTSEFGGLYGLQHCPTFTLPSLKKKKMKACLDKWSMLGGLKVQAFSFDRPFKGYLEEEFIQEFFASQAVASTFERVAFEGEELEKQFTVLNIPVDEVHFSPVPCTLTSLDALDKVVQQNPRICRDTGKTMPCLPSYYDHAKYSDDEANSSPMPVEMSNNLRKVAVYWTAPKEYRDDPEVQDDIQEIFTEEEENSQEEFMFQLFSHLVIGGSLCQYEDTLQPYLEATKGLYKDLLSVRKQQQRSKNDVEVASQVYKIHAISSSSTQATKNLLFTRVNLNNFLYLIVNPDQQTVYTLYHHV